jgi:sialate O-acetylesterase
MRNFIALLLVSLALPLHAAGLKLASPFADHMVLQRDQPIHIWGDADPNSSIKVNIAGDEVTTQAAPDGHWDAALKPLSAGGPHRLTVTAADKTVTLEDILIGDCWLCSGQSNMAMPLKECDDADTVAKQADRHPSLRLCTVGKGWNAKPQTKADIKWRTATPDTAKNFSAVAWYFASELLTDPALASIPIGLIDSSVGGTTCEGWIPNPALEKFDPKDLHDSMFGIKPGMLYNGMIAPLGRLPLKGVIWYQGEGNADHPDTYPKFLSTMIQQWRDQFAAPDLPFIIIQLPDFAPGNLHWQWIREAQAKAVADTPHTAFTLSINTTDGFDLHPKQKHEIGRRAALLARHDVYQQTIPARGPVFKSATAEDKTIRVTFDTAGRGLASSDPAGEIRGFAIAGDDGQYRFATGTIDGADSVLLRAVSVPAPKTVRYAWAGIPNSTLVTRGGDSLPAAPFRTDTLPPPDFELQKQPAARRIATSTYDITIAGDGQITSLVVRGKQFLSNAPGPAGGTSIPVFFGAKSLPNIQELGPNQLSCGDPQVTLLLTFHSDEMEWTLTNRSKDALNFRIALNSQVKITSEKDAQPVTVTRGKVTLQITGIESTADSEDGKFLQLPLKPNSEKHLLLKVQKP